MTPLYLLTTFLLILQANAIFILLPLYEYPSTSAAAWTNVTSAVSSNPSIHWQIIINPNSGPGTTQYPDANYIYGISHLNSYPNVQLLGYVDTAYAQRAYTSVVADINTYAGWSAHTPENISVAGIFFDDVSSTASSSNYKYYRNVTNYAYATVPSDVTPVVLNPGDPAPTQLFDYCDTMIEFEGTYANYKNATTIQTFPSAYYDQSAILVTATPAGAGTPLASLIHTMIQYGIAAVYFTLDTSYGSFSLVSLKQQIAAIVAG